MLKHGNPFGYGIKPLKQTTRPNNVHSNIPKSTHKIVNDSKSNSNQTIQNHVKMGKLNPNPNLTVIQGGITYSSLWFFISNTFPQYYQIVTLSSLILTSVCLRVRTFGQKSNFSDIINVILTQPMKYEHVAYSDIITRRN